MKTSHYFCEWSTCNSLTRCSNCLARNLVSFPGDNYSGTCTCEHLCTHSYSQMLSLHSRAQGLLNCILHTNHTWFSLSGPLQWLHLISPVYQDASSSVYQTGLHELPELWGGERWGLSVQRSRVTTCFVSEHTENKATHFKHTPTANIQNIPLFVMLIKMYLYVFWTYEYSALNYSKQDQKDTR